MARRRSRTTKRLMGRRSIFPVKDGALYHGILTRIGTKACEQARARLGHLAGWDPAKISDADLLEFLGRGEAETVKYLSQQP